MKTQNQFLRNRAPSWLGCLPLSLTRDAAAFHLLSIRAGVMRLSALAVLLCATAPAWATSYTWKTAASGNWNASANWTPTGVPGSGDSAAITPTGTYTVTVNDTEAVGTLTLGASTADSTVQTLSITGGSLTVNSASTGTAQGTLSISGGILEGQGALTLAGPLNWSGGYIGNGAGTGGIINFKGGTFSGSMFLDGGQLANSGTLSLTGTLYDGAGSVINNSGTVTITTTASSYYAVYYEFGGTAPVFNNTGTVTVTGGSTDSATIYNIFNNTGGTVNVNGGTLFLNGGGTETGPFSVVSGATLNLNGGTYAFNSGSTLSGAGNFTVNGGTANIGISLNLGGTWTFSSGTVNLTGATTASGNAVVISGATVTFSGAGPWKPGTLTVSSGILEGLSPIAVQSAGGFTWSGGYIGYGAGTGGIISFDGGAMSGTMFLYGGQLSNSGTVAWTGTLYDGVGSVFNNSGTVNINISSSGYSTYPEFGGTQGVFNNTGTVTVAGTTTDYTEIYDVFNNTGGTVDVNDGTLILGGGGTETGPFSVASGATLDFAGGTFTFNSTSTISGAGNLTVSGATVSFGSNLTMSGSGTFTVSSGTATVGGDLSLGGTWTFSGGTVNLTGTTSVSGNAVVISGATVTFSGTGPWKPGTLTVSGGILEGLSPVAVQTVGGFTWSGGYIGYGAGTGGIVSFNGGTISGGPALYGGELSNSGTVAWTATVYGGQGSVFNNSGTITITSTSSSYYALYFNYGGTAAVFNNSGTVTVTGGTGDTTTIYNVFNNTGGTVNVNEGTLFLNGGGTETGPFSVPTGTTLNLVAGTFNFNSGSSLTGAGSFTVSGATANIAISLNLSGTWTFSGGTANLTGTSTVVANAVIISGGTVNFSGAGPWKPATLTMSSGELIGSSPVVVQNAGGFTWTGGYIGYGAGTGGVVNFNGGTFSGQVNLYGGQLSNSGTLAWTANFYDGQGSVINNSGPITFTFPATFYATLFEYGGTRGVFNNTGTLTFAGANTAIAYFNDTLNNNTGGAVNVTGGSLVLGGGGTEVGSFTAVVNSSNYMNGGTFTINSGASFTGAGTLTIGGATANFTGTATFTPGSFNLTSGTADFTGAGLWQPATFNMSGGELIGSSPIAVQSAGGFNWSGGYIGYGVGTGGVVNFNGGTISGNVYLYGGELSNSGTLAWTGQVGDGVGSIINNSGPITFTFAATFDPTYYEFGGTRGVFNNTGTLTVTGGNTFYAYFYDTLNNNTGGAVHVTGGSFVLEGGGTEVGSFTAVVNSSNYMNGGTFTINSGASFTGAGALTIGGAAANFTGTATFTPGTLNLTSGTADFTGAGPWQPGSFNMSGGELIGASPVAVQNAGGFTWTGGYIGYGAGTGGVVNFNGGTFSGSVYLYGGQLSNSGTLAWMANVYDGVGSVINNSGNITFTFAATFYPTYPEFGAPGGVFNNTGTITVAGANTFYAYFYDTFNNNTGGAVNVTGGSFVLENGGTEVGAFTALVNCSNYLNGGTFAINTGCSISGAGALTVGGGTANFAGTATFDPATLNIAGGTANFTGAGPWQPGSFNMISGELLGSSPVAVQNVGGFMWSGGYIGYGAGTGGMVNFNGGTFSGGQYLYGGELSNSGALAWSSVVYDGAGSIINNSGNITVTFTTTTYITYPDFGGTRGVFNNTGTLSATAPTADTAYLYDTFNNDGGKLNAIQGTIYLENGQTLTGGTLNSGINSLSSDGQITFPTATPLTGTLSANLNGGYVPAIGSTFDLVNYPSFTGSFTNTNLPSIAIWQTTYNPTDVTIKLLKYVPTITWPTPAEITYGTALSSAQLDATALSPASATPLTGAGTFTYSPPLGTVLNASNNQVLTVIFTPSVADQANFSSATNTVLINVEKAPLTVTADNESKKYGQTYTFLGTEFTSLGLVNGDSIASVTLTSLGAPGSASVADSPYSIVPTNAVNSSDVIMTNNYNITYVDGLLTVNGATLTITANSRSKVYGQTVVFAGTEFTANGLQNGDSIGTATVTLTSSGAGPTATVGMYNIVPSALTGESFSPGNYTIVYDNGTLTVTAAPLNITANSTSKTYGQTLNLGVTAFTITGGTLFNGDTVTGVTLSSPGAAATATVAGSPYAINATAAVGTGLGNYAITYAPGSLTVSQAPLTITASAQSKTYGQTLSLGTTAFTITGTLYNGDTVTGVTLSSSGAASTATVAGSPYSITAASAVGTGLGNYAITYAPGSLTVSQAPLTITASAQSKTYGQTLTLGTTAFTITGGTLYNGDTVTGVTLSSPGAASTATVAGSPYSITASVAVGTGLGNYAITYAPGSLTVSQAPLTITASAQSKTYGQTLNLGTTDFTTTGTLYNGDTATGVTLSSSGAAATATVAGSPYTINATAAVGTGLGNYAITYAPGSLTVNQAALTITASAQSKIYGQTLNLGTTDFTIAGTLYNGDTVTGVTLSSAGAASSAAPGMYPILPTDAVGSGVGNYAINYVGGTLTVTSSNCDPAPSGLVSWWQGNGNTFDVVGGNTGTLENGVTYVAGEVGQAFNFDSDSAMVVVGNPANLQLQNFTIEAWVKRGSTTVASSDSTAEDGSAVLFGYGENGYGLGMLPNGTIFLTKIGVSSVSSAATVTDTAFHHLAVTVSAGTVVFYVDGVSYAASGPYNPTYLFTTSAAIGGRADNLNVNNNDSFLGTIDEMSIYNRALSGTEISGIYNAGAAGKCIPAITVTWATPANINYGTALSDAQLDATANVAGTFTYDPPLGTVLQAGADQTLSVSFTATDTADYPNPVTSTVTINVQQVPLTITANPQSKTYGQALNLGTTAFTITGTLYNGDTVTGVTLNSPGAAATATVGGSPYTITPSVAVGTGVANYNITYVTGSLSVSPAGLAITASAQSKTYGQTLNLGTTAFTTGTLYNGDTVTGVTLSSPGAAATATVAGSPYAINATDAVGTGLGNYTISYVPGSLTVSQAPLTITASAQSKTYGQTFNLGTTAFTITGTLFNGDTVTGVTLSSPGAASTATVAGSPYTITASAAAGTGLGNYAITYAPGLLTVSQAPLTITASAQSKTYGQTLNLGTTAFTTGTLYNGDTVTAVTLSSPGAAATATVAGSPYTITASAAVGTGLGNYAIIYAPGSLTVNQAALTITASAQSKTYGQTLNLGTTAFTITGTLFNGDTVTAVTLSSPGAAATATVAGSPYTITASAAVGTGVGNYNITYAPGSLTVGQAALTITASAQSKTYGQTLNLGTTAFTITGTLFNGDTVTAVTLSSPGAAATATVAGSPYTITAGSAVGTGLGNYAITYAPGSLTLSQAPLTITASPQTKNYGQTLNLGTTAFTTTTLYNGDTVTGVTLTSTGAASSAAPGMYPIVPSAAVGSGLANYSILYVSGTLTVGSAGATITCPDNITVNQATGECSQIVDFAPVVGGNPTPTLVCTFDGNIITSPFSFPVGTNVVTCTASNISGMQTCSFTVTVVDTNLPVAGPNSLGTYENQTAAVSVAKMLIRDSAPSGGTLSISSVVPTTPSGGSVSLGGGLITYVPPANYFGLDSITYTLSDGCGTVPGTINVEVLSTNLPAKNQVSITQTVSGTTVVFAGVPGATYVVQSSSAVTGPWTNLSGPIIAAANGSVQYTDTTSPPPPTRYYRIQYVSGP